MKKILFTLLTLAWTYSAYSERFNPGMYEYDSSEKNTSSSEQPMSPYQKGSLVFFRNDTAYMFFPKKDGEVGDLIVCPELMGLGIEGTFAYDETEGKLYFSKKQIDGNKLFEATYKGDKWTNVRKLNIMGVGPAKRRDFEGSTLVVARWMYHDTDVLGFYNPSLAKKGERIYFSGDFRAGKGERDIWYIEREEDDLWTFPESVGDLINTSRREDFAFVVNDSALYFASDREGGNGELDLYVSYITRKGKWGIPENLSELNSPAADYNLVFCQKRPYFISNREGGKGSDDIYCVVPPPPEREPELTINNMLIEARDFLWILFYFDFDKSMLNPEYESQLDEMVTAMKEYPTAEFEIQGHTDIRGSDEYNMDLSQRRADFVKSMLIRRGIPASKMITVPCGKRKLAIPNARDEAEHEQNRRVEVRIVND